MSTHGEKEAKSMKSRILSMTCSGLLFCSLSIVKAAPQYRDDDPWHQSRERYYSTDNWRAKMFDRIKMDLDHVQELAFGRNDENRLAMTKDKVSELQGKMAAGKYDQPELDEVIADLEKVVADNRLAARDRDMLADDLNRVREYRSNHENWH
jgi:hypothetical protein